MLIYGKFDHQELLSLGGRVDIKRESIADIYRLYTLLASTQVRPDMLLPYDSFYFCIELHSATAVVSTAVGFWVTHDRRSAYGGRCERDTCIEYICLIFSTFTNI